VAFLKSRWPLKAALCGLLPLLLPPNAMAAGDVLDMQQAVQRTIQTHPAVGTTMARFQQSHQEITGAKAGYLPRFSTGFDTTYRDSTGRTEEVLSVQGTQLLYDFGKVASRVRMAESSEEVAHAQALLVVDELAREAAYTLLEVQRYQQLVEIAEARSRGIASLWELSRRRSSMGASARSDEMQAKSRHQAAVASEAQIKSELKSWQSNLKHLTGLEHLPKVSNNIPERLNEACSVAGQDFSQVPELRVAEAQIKEAQAMLEGSKASYYPTINVEARAERFLHDNNRRNRDRDDYTVGINASMDLYQGGATKARASGAAFALEAARGEREEALLRLTRSLQEAQAQASSYNVRLSTLAEQIRNVTEAQHLYRQQYISLGTRSLLDLLNTEQEIYQTQMELVNTQQDLGRLQVGCSYDTAQLRTLFAISTEFLAKDE